MNRILALAAATLMFVAMPVTALAQGDDSLEAQFQAIIDDLNANSFRKFHDAIDEDVYAGRILGTRVIDPDARRALLDNFREMIETWYASTFPAPRTQEEVGSAIIGTVVSFEDDGSQARAIVRFEGAGFRFSYHLYDVAPGRGGRIQIVDWFDYYQSEWFSVVAGNSLVRMMPGPRAIASLLENPGPTEGQLFQVGELFKAVRDGNPRRYAQIYDGLEDVLKNEPVIVVQNFHYWRAFGDPGRLQGAAGNVVATFPGDPRHSLGLAEYYIQRGRFEDAIVELDRLEEGLGMKDGVLESLKATSAMALGDFERAQAFAASAAQVEPTLELSWWTLLRTRTAAENYSGALEALTQLEDRFGHLLIPQKLRRDRFLKVLIDQQEYKDWRAGRDQA